jgi:hypothetical protein
MKSLIALAGLLMLLVSGGAQADTMTDFVRVTCAPETGLLDVEYRALHDSVARDMRSKVAPAENALVKHGFYSPRGLDLTCKLGEVVYHVSGEQDPERDRGTCGADPEVFVTVTRNGAPILNHVVFGDSCWGAPSVRSITFGDGPPAWRGAEAHICYSPGAREGHLYEISDVTLCEWVFDRPGNAFTKHFPLDGAAIKRNVESLRKQQLP